MLKYITMMLMTTQVVLAHEANHLNNETANEMANKPASYMSKTKQVADNVWIGPQPTEQDFNALPAEEIGAVINNRTAAEVKSLDFNEIDLASQNGINYDLLEIGEGNAYSPVKLMAFNDLMTANADKNILLHCRSGHRSTQLYTAWLVKYQGKTAAEALKAVGSDEIELNDSVKALLGQ